MSQTTPAIVHRNEAAEYFTEEGCRILEAWNRDVDAALSIARARVSPGTRTRLHRLHGIVERYVVLEGQGYVEVGDLPAEVVVAGDLVYIPPGCPQRITSLGNTDLVFLAVCTPRFVPEAYEDIDRKA